MRAVSSLLFGIIGLLLTAPAHSGQLETLSWLAGCWSRDGADAGSGEYWLPVEGGMMLGIGRTVKEGKTVEYEFISVHSDSDGRAIYTARPSSQKETAFASISMTDDTVVFENPEHDFPQRITYRREGTKRMIARIEGERRGNVRGIDFRFSRVSCRE